MIARAKELAAERAKDSKALRQLGFAPYPFEFSRRYSLQRILQNFSRWRRARKKLWCAGRVVGLRRHGAITFLDLADGTGKLQALLAPRGKRGIYPPPELIDLLDIVEVRGVLDVTKRGEKSIVGERWRPLAKSLASPPAKRKGVRDAELRERYPEWGWIFDAERREVVEKHARLLQVLRRELVKAGFLEVQTPVLQNVPSGAAAEPFRTRSKALDTTLYLRISPELYLKRILVGGWQKIFELGPCFRNEGIDRAHHPEFTMCELYWAYGTLPELLRLTERLCAVLAREVGGSAELEWGGTKLNFRPPFKRLRWRALMRKVCGFDVLKERSLTKLQKTLRRLGGKMPPEKAYLPLIEAIFKHAVRPKLISPVFVEGGPRELEPLAKEDAEHPGETARFQLLAGGMEIVKAYVELNDPEEQARRFAEQRKTRGGDAEYVRADEVYLQSLRIGLPPAVGWGMGIERMLMLLSNQRHLRDVLTFPTLRPAKSS
jgi:lysyl-tRNA synthetase class 2